MIITMNYSNNSKREAYKNNRGYECIREYLQSHVDKHN
jgi:hypothetical protein